MSDQRGVDGREWSGAEQGYRRMSRLLEGSADHPLPWVDWPPGTPLTSITTPSDAAAALRAADRTSVLHPTGMRWLGPVRLVFLVTAVVMLAGILEGVRRGFSLPPWFFPALIITNLNIWRVELTVAAVDPLRSELGTGRLAKIRAYVRAWGSPASATPVQDWPPGSESWAILSVASRTRAIDRLWLYDRTGLAEEVGDLWVEWLGRCELLSPGSRVVGLRWLRTPVSITSEGKDALAAERARLEALAVSG